MVESSNIKQIIQQLQELEGHQKTIKQNLEDRILELEQENLQLRSNAKETFSPLDEVTDEELKSRFSMLGSPPLDTLIREAGVVLENRIRKQSRLSPSVYGTKLVDAAFSVDNGVVEFSTHPSEQEGVKMLYRGAIQFIRNPPMHKLIEYPESTARLLLRLIDALLQLLAEAGPEKDSEDTEKSGSQRRTWTEEKFFAVLEENCDVGILTMIKGIYEWGHENADRIWFGTGKEIGSFTFHYIRDRKTVSVFSIFTNGRITLNYGWLSDKLPQSVLDEFHRRIIQVKPFKRIRPEFDKWPSVDLTKTDFSKEDIKGLKSAVIYLRDAIDSLE